MTFRLWIYLPENYWLDTKPQFRCSIHDEIMIESDRNGFKCSKSGCNQKLEFHDIQKIAQWLKGYA